MKRALVYVITTVCLVGGLGEASGQDMRKVIAVVGELEDSVKVMFAREGRGRADDVARLRSEVSALHRAIDEMRLAQLARPPEPLQAHPPVAVVPTPAAATDVFPNIKVGLLAQMQAFGGAEQTSAAQDADPKYQSHWQRQLYVRRLRVLAAGNIARTTSFFFDSDAPNIGKVTASGTKATAVTMYVQDAYLQHMFMPELGLVAGLQLVGISRNGLQSAASLMALNYGSYQFMTSGALDNSVGRDVGFSARGFLADDRLEYRAGVYAGKSMNMYSPLRYTARLAYNFLDREKGFFYTGTTLGKGQLFSIGGGIDMQSSYSAYALDGFLDIPLFDMGSVTASVSFSHLDGGGSDADSTFFTGQLPRQNVLFAELGYYIKDVSLQPYIKYERQGVDATVWKQVGATSTEALALQNHLRSNSRFGIGVNYFLSGHGLSFKLVYEHVSRNRLTVDKKSWEAAGNGEMTLQVQYFAL